MNDKLTVKEILTVCVISVLLFGFAETMVFDNVSHKETQMAYSVSGQLREDTLAKDVDDTVELNNVHINEMDNGIDSVFETISVDWVVLIY